MASKLKDHCVLRGGTGFPEDYQGNLDGSIPFIKVSDMSSPGNKRRIEFAANYVDLKTAQHLNAVIFPANSTVFAKVGAALFLNKRRMLSTPTIIDNNMMAAIPRETEADFLFYFLSSLDFAIYAQPGALPSVNQSTLGAIQFPSFTEFQQRRIAEILSTVDEAIEQTEALIAKYQQVKAGLMHDLFTRGVLPDGSLRPTRAEAPHLYKETPLGWLPKEWEAKRLPMVADSVIDGPFGSNLKTEHYVSDPGVRVVRLQNIHEAEYSDADRAFVSDRHAQYLARHIVEAGDVLIAALGDDNFEVGRACCYPVELGPAINKADCIRLRSDARLALNPFVMYCFNTELARVQLRRLKQGVTRQRINLSSLQRVILPIPDLREQALIVERLMQLKESRHAEAVRASTLHQIKQGLMHDLLTGRVRVPTEEAVPV
jgi:type I restriction enzyme S subunit